MDWKAFAKAEDKLSKAVEVMNGAADGKARDRAEQKVLDAAREWHEQRSSRSDSEIKATRSAEKDLDKAYAKYLDASPGKASEKASERVKAAAEALAHSRMES